VIGVIGQEWAAGDGEYAIGCRIGFHRLIGGSLLGVPSSRTNDWATAVAVASLPSIEQEGECKRCR
jgi:hypothetical protein